MQDIRLLTLITVLCHSAAAGTRVAGSLFALDLGASPLVVGLIMGSYAVLPMFLSVGAGRLSDRIGARIPMLVGALGIALGALAVFAGRSLTALLAGSCLIGCGFMLFNVAMQNVAGHIGDPSRRTANLSLVALGFSLSTLIGPTLAGIAIDAIGHAPTFLLFAAFPVVPALVLGFNALKLPCMPAAGHGRRRVMDLLKDPGLLRVFIVTTLLSTAWELYSFVMPVYGASVGLSPTAIGLVMGCFSAAIIIVRLILPFVVNRVDAWRVMTSTLIYGGAIYFLFPLAHTFGMLAALSLLLGLGLGIPQPLIIMLLHNHAPPGRAGEAIGLRQATIYATQTSMPVTFGALGAALGMGAVFWIIALCLCSGGIYGRRNRVSPRVQSSGAVERH